MLNIQTKTI